MLRIGNQFKVQGTNVAVEAWLGATGAKGMSTEHRDPIFWHDTIVGGMV